MAKNAPIYAFDKDCDDFSTTGLVGDLMPISAEFEEEKNGISEVVIRMPYDVYEKWKACRVGNYIQCEVPVRTPPVINNDEYANTVPIGQ